MMTNFSPLGETFFVIIMKRPLEAEYFTSTVYRHPRNPLPHYRSCKQRHFTQILVSERQANTGNLRAATRVDPSSWI
jgi:hypothetical protein